jgi:hypothetical protein
LRRWSGWHLNLDVVYNHYKALVLKTDAEKFWNLRPKTPEEGKNSAAKQSIP